MFCWTSVYTKLKGDGEDRLAANFGNVLTAELGVSKVNAKDDDKPRDKVINLMLNTAM